uniref:hypothetical protein n=1 Tax=uncultured Caulobacter sp. TaxID=158749 RepID=UPI0025F12554|nr:hypothetical protein [uncultured Caulobacter sp.]
MRLAVDKDGAGGARRLWKAGITCFVLGYRLAVDGWTDGYDAALQDVQRAVRLIRANATTWGMIRPPVTNSLTRARLHAGPTPSRPGCVV